MQIQIYKNRTHKSAYIFLRVFTYKMAAEINWHRRGTKLRHCHAGDECPCVPVTSTSVACCYEGGAEALVNDCCRLWRRGWTAALGGDEDPHHITQLRRLPTCRCRSLRDVVCLNPYHWSVNVTPAFINHSRTHVASLRFV